MPTYEYECIKCGHVNDVFHAMSAKPRVKCPECGGRTKKLIGAGAGIIFKGSGFYETDYKKKPNSGPVDRKTEPAKEKTSESKTETKSKDSTDSSKKN